MKYAAVQQLLRAADPAADLPRSDPAEVEAVLNATRSKPVEFALIESATAQRRAASRRLPVALAAAAVIAVAGVAVGVAGYRTHHTPQGSDRRQPVTLGIGRMPISTSTPSVDPNYPPALAQAEEALNTLPALPGAKRLDVSPVESLDEPSEYSPGSNEIQRHTYWTAPGTAQDAIDYLEAHPPAHTTLNGSGSGGPMVDLTAMFAGTPGRYAGLSVVLEVVPYGSGVAVRGDVEVLWYSTKPVAEYIGTVSSVDVVVNRSNSGRNGLKHVPNVHRTLTGAQAQSLAAAVDAAKLGDSSERSCPVSFGYTDLLTFHPGSRTIVVTVQVGGCEGMQVTVNGVQQPYLLGGVDNLVTKDLGLPSNYGG